MTDEVRNALMLGIAIGNLTSLFVAVVAYYLAERSNRSRTISKLAEISRKQEQHSAVFELAKKKLRAAEVQTTMKCGIPTDNTLTAIQANGAMVEQTLAAAKKKLGVSDEDWKV